MKHLITCTVLVAALLFLDSANAELRILERPYEVTQLRIIMRTPNTGEVLVNECETCEDVTLKITPETKFFKGDREIPLAQAFRHRGQEAVVMRDAESNDVVRIMIY